MKRNSLFFIYLSILALSIWLFNPSSITTDMLSIFKSDKNIEKLRIMNSFENSSRLFVTIKGFDKENRDRLKAIGKELEKLEYIKETKFRISKIEISDYIKNNYYLLSKFRPIAIDNDEIKDRVAKLKESLLDQALYQPIDKNDPFKLFEFNIFSGDTLANNGFLALGDYGYLLSAKLDSKVSDIESAKKIEQELSTLFAKYNSNLGIGGNNFEQDEAKAIDSKKYAEVVAFSTLFFTAQNSTVIKSSVHTILYISFALLIILFLFTLRDYRVLLSNITTLASSIFVALALSTYIFDELSIFTLAFGSAISSISVDYLFHNYFHFQYRKKSINRTVLVAFLTTLLGFVMLQFVSFPLIAQLSLFAMISLSFSYFQFSFIYPYFGFVPQKRRVSLEAISNLKTVLPINIVFGLSLLAIIYAGVNIEFDYNLRNLDYDNQELKIKKEIIEKNMPQKSTILIEADSVDALIEKANILQKSIASTNSIAKIAFTEQEFQKKQKQLSVYDFKKLKELLIKNSKEQGFKESYFESAYNFTETISHKYSHNLDSFRELGYEVIKKDSKFYTIATIDKKDLNKLKESRGVYLINSLDLIKDTTKKVFDSLLFYLFLSFLSIVIIVAVIAKQKSILALNFILFPVAMILLYLSIVDINIMHLFSIIIVIVAGVDYGIYMSQESSKETKEAIFYSLLTSFSGFGILVLSAIGAIHSIGIVITIGVLSILLLVLFLERE